MIPDGPYMDVYEEDHLWRLDYFVGRYLICTEYYSSHSAAVASVFNWFMTTCRETTYPVETSLGPKPVYRYIPEEASCRIF